MSQLTDGTLPFEKAIGQRYSQFTALTVIAVDDKRGALLDAGPRSHGALCLPVKMP